MVITGHGMKESVQWGSQVGHKRKTRAKIRLKRKAISKPESGVSHQYLSILGD